MEEEEEEEDKAVMKSYNRVRNTPTRSSLKIDTITHSLIELMSTSYFLLIIN